MADEKRGGWGGRRAGAGRKPKKAAPLAPIDTRAAEAAPPPGDITTVAEPKAGDALASLVKQLKSGRSESAKVAAANAILDRGYGKPGIDLGGEPMLPFGRRPEPPENASLDVRSEARKWAHLAIEVLSRIATAGNSESARVTAARSILDRGLGTVATAKIPEGIADTRPMSKKDERRRAAEAAATGRYAVPKPPGEKLN